MSSLVPRRPTTAQKEHADRDHLQDMERPAEDCGIPPFLTRSHWRVEPAVVNDVGFIVDSWCSDEHVNVGRQSNEDNDIAKAGMRGRVLRLLSKYRCAVARPTAAYFAATGQTPNAAALFGWVCYAVEHSTLNPVVFFVYVRPHDNTSNVTVRGRGVGDSLLAAAGVREGVATWCTSDRLRLGKAMKKRNILYNKYLLDCNSEALR